MTNETHRIKVLGSQRGMVSITVTMVLMIVLSLIVIGFAQVARRNQRVALDQHLSTQAFYAAESGVNEVSKLIKDAATIDVPAKTDCASPGGVAFYSSLNSTINTGNGVSYSCLLVDPAPKSLKYDNVYDPSNIVPVISQSRDNITSIKLVWQSESTTPMTGCPADTNARFTPTASWTCGYGVLRFDLVPIPGGTFNIDSLSATTMTTFAVPVTVGGTNTMNFAAGAGQDVVSIACTSSNCSLTINIAGANLSNQYYMRVKSIYKPVSLEVTGKNAAGVQQNLAAAQVMVDATGKAQDVLRRIQVRLPIADSRNKLPDYAMQSSTSVCKRFSTMDGYFGQSGIPVTGGQMCTNTP